MGDEISLRDDKGKFVPGHSGNVAGRPVGIRNSTTLVKDFINNALVTDLQEDAIEILAVAIKKAKDGDNAMIKLLLSDLLAQSVADDVGEPDIVIQVKNMTFQTKSDGITIDNEDIE